MFYHNVDNICSQESNIVPGAQPPVMPHPISLGPPSAQAQQLNMPTTRPPFAKEYYFLDIELRYGLLQVSGLPVACLRHNY